MHTSRHWAGFLGLQAVGGGQHQQHECGFAASCWPPAGECPQGFPSIMNQQPLLRHSRKLTNRLSMLSCACKCEAACSMYWASAQHLLESLMQGMVRSSAPAPATHLASMY